MYLLILSIFWILLSSTLVFFYEPYADQFNDKHGDISFKQIVLISIAITSWPISLLPAFFLTTQEKRKIKDKLVLSLILPLLLLAALFGECLSKIKDLIFASLIVLSLLINFNLLGVFVRTFLETNPAN